MKSAYLFVMCVTFLIIMQNLAVRVSSSSPTIYINPAYKQVTLNQNFTIDVYIGNVTHLYGFEIFVSFDPSKLNATRIEYEGFLNNPVMLWTNETNNTAGYATIAFTSEKPALGKNGISPPPLATVYFTSIGLGDSPIHLYNTTLADDQAIAIPHTTIDGLVHVGTSGVHDVAVTNVTTCTDGWKPFPTVYINVTVQNQGDFAETFNVTEYANAITIATYKYLTLPSHNSITVSFTWRNYGFAPGNYTISAYAWPVLGETDTADNTFTDGTVQIYPNNPNPSGGVGRKYVC